jgi:anti-anti-sigma factor
MTSAGSPGGDSSSHVLLLFRKELQRQARVVSWVRQGLSRGEKILYSAVPGDTLVPALRNGGRDAAVALHKGQLAFVPDTDFFPGGKQAELVHRALDEGYSAVRLSARADAALRRASLEDYEAIDLMMDELCASLPVAALCQLDAGSASTRILRGLIDSHTGVVEDHQMRLHRRGGQVVLAGEVDFSSAEVLTEALRSLCRLQSTASTVIDLSELTFVDASGCRALVIGTEELRRAGGGVSIRGASVHIRKVMALLGMYALPRIELL